MRRKLAVAGCSISDRTKTTHCYGDYLADMLDMDYLHLAGGGGSNQRSIRLIQEAVLDGTLLRNDVVLFQITDTTRCELKSALMSTPAGMKVAQAQIMMVQVQRENATIEVGGTGFHEDLEVSNWDITEHGVYSRFKMLSHGWQPKEEDQKLHEQFEQYGVVSGLCMHEFRLQLAMLRTFLHHHGVKFYVFVEHLGRSFETWCTENQYSALNDNDIYLDNIWPLNCADDWHSNPEYFKYHLIPGEDAVHYSIDGHNMIAQCLYQPIKDRI